METVAKTILSQIGGSMFMMMTGSKVQSVKEDGITFKLTKNTNGHQYLEITLTPADMYVMKFIKIRGSKKVVKQFDDIFCDMLSDIFENETGLYTHF